MPITEGAFDWRETAERLAQFVHQRPRIEARSGGFADLDRGLLFRLPLVLPSPDVSLPVDAYQRQLTDRLARQAVFLARAGATAIGLWDTEDELVAHKVFKRYVVRGNGRAQPTHLATKGKSRYGSRLRLQNARRLLEETNQRLCDWSTEPIERAFVSCPKRLLADFRQASPTFPFAPESVLTIPFHVNEPGHTILLQVRRRLSKGRIVPLHDTSTADP